MKRFPSKLNALHSLRELGVDIGTVIDVGVHMDTVELRQAYPDKPHILFEPTSEFHPAIRANYKDLDYFLSGAAVSNVDGEAKLEKVSIDGSGITHSGIVEDVASGNLTSIATVRLNTFMSQRQDSKPYLLKIDVDGHERQVLEGCEGLWKDIAVVVIEVTQGTLLDRLMFLADRGFSIFDIVNTCYYYDVFAQADLVMISPEAYQHDAMRPWQTREFQWSSWVDIGAYEPAVQADAVQTT